MKNQIVDSRGVQIGWSLGGVFYKDKADCPISDPLPVFIKERRKRSR